MAYAGYLVKLGTWQVPEKYIRYNSFKSLWSVNDIDSYRDANGELHRNALQRRTLKVEWEIPPMSDTDLNTFISTMRSQMSNTREQKLSVTAWCPMLNTYKTETCYLTSDVEFNVRLIDASHVYYDATRVAFIGYTTASATD